MPGTLVITTLSDGTNSTSATNCIQGSAKAWVNFDGTNAFSPNPSTSAIRGSFNVGSITRNGTGDYTINFTTAMSNTNYSCIAQVYAGGNNSTQFRTKTEATSSVQLSGLVNQSGTAQNAVDIDVMVLSS